MIETKLGVIDFTAEHFSPYQGRILKFQRPDDDQQKSSAPVELKLVDVQSLPAGRQRPFSLLFLSVNGEQMSRRAMPPLSGTEVAPHRSLNRRHLIPVFYSSQTGVLVNGLTFADENNVLTTPEPAAALLLSIGAVALAIRRRYLGPNC